MRVSGQGRSQLRKDGEIHALEVIKENNLASGRPRYLSYFPSSHPMGSSPLPIHVITVRLVAIECPLPVDRGSGGTELQHYIHETNPPQRMVDFGSWISPVLFPNPTPSFCTPTQGLSSALPLLSLALPSHDPVSL